jgi:hypothetical protein
MRGVEAPNSISAPAFIKKSATSVNPPQHAKVRAVSWVSSVCALMLAPAIQYNSKAICERYFLVNLQIYCIMLKDRVMIQTENVEGRNHGLIKPTHPVHALRNWEP